MSAKNKKISVLKKNKRKKTITSSLFLWKEETFIFLSSSWVKGMNTDNGIAGIGSPPGPPGPQKSIAYREQRATTIDLIKVVIVASPRGKQK